MGSNVRGERKIRSGNVKQPPHPPVTADFQMSEESAQVSSEVSAAKNKIHSLFSPRRTRQKTRQEKLQKLEANRKSQGLKSLTPFSLQGLDFKKQLRKRKHCNQQEPARAPLCDVKVAKKKKPCPNTNMASLAQESLYTMQRSNSTLGHSSGSNSDNNNVYHSHKRPGTVKNSHQRPESLDSNFKRACTVRSSLQSTKFYSKKYINKQLMALQTPTKRRPSKLWSETFTKDKQMSPSQIKRQEAIFELNCGEENLVEDLKMVKEVYCQPMLTLHIMSKEELESIFGGLETFLPLHNDLIVKLRNARQEDGTIDRVGEIMLEWFPGLRCYITYCNNQHEAKDLLDQKIKSDKGVADFLQRCQESPFSRKLDLWSFLDIPRSRLVKYPLLLKYILKLTPHDHPDKGNLEEAIRCIENLIEEVNKKTGEGECEFVKSRLYFLDERQRSSLIDKSKRLLLRGVLKNKNGTKLHVFLFDQVLILTRPATRNNKMCYQLFTQPMRASTLVVEDLPDGDVRIGGSFKSAIALLTPARNIFRVSSTDPLIGHSHTLQASSEHDKKQWLHTLRSVLSDSDNYRTCV